LIGTIAQRRTQSALTNGQLKSRMCEGRKEVNEQTICTDNLPATFEQLDNTSLEVSV